MLKTFKLPVGVLGSNCFLAWDSRDKQAAIIDPGGEPERIIEAVDRRGLDVRYILLTHGHGDHIGANREIKKRYGAPLLIHEADAPMLTDPRLNMSAYFGVPVTSPPRDSFLVPGEKILLGGLELAILLTAGHTPGGVSLYVDGVVFTGDSLFYGSIGRCDMPDCDEDLLLRCIRDNLFSLPDDTQVLPGHGQNTTIGVEKRCNPYLV